jgi:hypothetical protein
MLGGHEALEELSARRFCRETMRPTIRRVFGHFYGVVPSMAVALFSSLELPYFASIMCAVSIMNRFMTCVIA